jgi:hypothetical protein
MKTKWIGFGEEVGDFSRFCQRESGEGGSLSGGIYRRSGGDYWGVVGGNIWGEGRVRGRLGFFFDSLAEPLLHHALVVEVTGASDSFDAGEETRIEAESDGSGLAAIGFEERCVHQAAIDACGGPEGRLVFFSFKGGNFSPVGDDIHGSFKGI